MKALKAIGIKKALAFIWFVCVTTVLHLLFIPQIRALLVRCLGGRVGSDSTFGNVTFANLYHYGFSRLKVGNRVFVGDEVMLDTRGGITLEDDVTISNRSIIITHINVGYADHPLQKYYPAREARVTIRTGAYIATGAMILPGVTIGKMAVVGAGAVVTRDVPDRTVVAGVPARVIKRL
jgi:acetyltransferase-like isoleucine patch superfamily enzyme